MTSPRPRVVITRKVFPQVVDLLGASCRVIANDSAEGWPREQLLSHVREADALMACMPDLVDGQFLELCPRLKLRTAPTHTQDCPQTSKNPAASLLFSSTPL